MCKLPNESWLKAIQMGSCICKSESERVIAKQDSSLSKEKVFYLYRQSHVVIQGLFFRLLHNKFIQCPLVCGFFKFAVPSALPVDGVDFTLTNDRRLYTIEIWSWFVQFTFVCWIVTWCGCKRSWVSLLSRMLKRRHLSPVCKIACHHRRVHCCPERWFHTYTMSFLFPEPARGEGEETGPLSWWRPADATVVMWCLEECGLGCYLSGCCFYSLSVSGLCSWPLMVGTPGGDEDLQQRSQIFFTRVWSLMMFIIVVSAMCVCSTAENHSSSNLQNCSFRYFQCMVC